MKNSFNEFKNKSEEKKASTLIETIDKGEKWIFEGGKGSDEFGGFVDRLYYSDGENYGTFCSCIFLKRLRIIAGFKKDIPEILQKDFINLIHKARKVISSVMNVWFVPTNEKLYNILKSLPWESKGHNTYEFTAYRENFEDSEINIPKNFSIENFKEDYLTEACKMLDESLAHTFQDPKKGFYIPNKDFFLKEFLEKTKKEECKLLLNKEEIVGMYILKGTEIDIMAIKKSYQNNGLGKLLLHHSINHILTNQKELPYLYCIDSNKNAIRFYKREGLKVTGHSGYLVFPELK